MPATVVVGLQWGDEGKGKTTDLLAAGVQYVVRYQGGDNAGHTIVLGDEVFKLHLVPSGVFDPRLTPVIGNGVVVNPARLIEEMDGLSARGVDVARLRVSTAAHVILPHHLALDAALEGERVGGELGTTNRGIGPAYADRALRVGLRLGDLADRDLVRARLERSLPLANAILRGRFGHPGFEVEPIVALAAGWAERLAPYLTETTALLHAALAAGQRVLLEGAQGALLDLDQGTYPYVTSSNPGAGGASTGSGIGPRHIDRVVGVMKAYVTRVGAGPFPTELHDETGDHLRRRGHEFGTTTGRPRRCGWFDAVVVRYAVRVNGLTGLAVTKLDVLDSFAEIPVCVGYRLDGEAIDSMPAEVEPLARVEPVYECLPGWQQSLCSVRRLADLPPPARAYLDRLQDLARAPIRYVSVGTRRDQIIEVA
ncbi:MAG TPA: adenylosuccinate synthase [Candidatus Sulfotelmatobacter sp.]|nr:adenylosuccinate synthase [Candidatus Sulfotelmatobacter sp.]